MLSETVHSLSSYVAAVSIDVLGVVGVTALILAFSLAKGKDELVAIILSLYPAALITLYTPHTYVFPTLGFSESAARLTIFLVGLAVITYFVRRYIDTGYEPSGLKHFLGVLVLSVVAVGFGLAILYQIVQIEQLYNFSFLLDTLFMSNTALLIWLFAPLGSMPIIIRS